MSKPPVIEIIRRPEPVAHDPFIDDLAGRRGSERGTPERPPR